MSKIDLTKTHKAYYSAKPQPEEVTIAPASYVGIEGQGDPSSEGFAKAVQALYATAYTIKFVWKNRGSDFTVAKLEGLWWFDEEKYGHVPMEEAPVRIPRSEWMYRLLIRMPEFVTKDDIEQAAASAALNKDLPLARQVKPYALNEGKVVQMLHVGPFDREPETLAVMMDFMSARRMQRNGLHHEIYLSDFRKTAPEKLKTILREPVV